MTVKTKTGGDTDHLRLTAEPGNLTRKGVEPDYSHSAILRTAEQWQSAVDAIVDPIFIHDSEFRIIRANKAYAREAGLPVQEVIGKRYWEVFPRLSGPLPACQPAMEQHEKREDELTLDDGRILISCAYAVFSRRAEHVYSVHVLRDVTNLRKSEQENHRLIRKLRRSDASFRQVAESVPDILFAMNPSTLELTYVNPAVQHLLGYTPQQLLQQPKFWLTALHEDDCQQVLSDLAHAVTEKKGVQLECRIWHQDRQGILWFDARSHVLLDEDGEVDKLVGVLTDISSRKQAEGERLEATEQLSNSLVQTIQAIAATLAKRDPYTAGHQQRVTQLATAIAREMGLDKERIRGIELGGLVHDIGKIYVPAEILNRPGKLTAAEFEIIKSHSEVGYDIIKDIEFPWPVADMVRQHHERIDGSGYPDGLSGNQIILEARILAVADVVEAISSHRPYRPALGVESAFTEIERGRGKIYDPDVVDICLRLFREKKFAFN